MEETILKEDLLDLNFDTLLELLNIFVVIEKYELAAIVRDEIKRRSVLAPNFYPFSFNINQLQH